MTLPSSSPRLLLAVLGVAAEADGLAADAAGDDVVQADEGAAADEQDVRGVHLDVLLLGVLAAALRRDVADGAFEHLEQGLLHALAGDVAGDADVLAGLGDLVDLVDVDDAALGRLDVEVGGVQQLEQQVLDVLADVAGFGQRGGVADGERHVEDLGQGAGQQGLAAAGRADEQDVALVDLDVVVAVFVAEAEPLVVVVHRDRQHLLGAVLADDVLVELVLDRARRRNIGDEALGDAAAALLLVDDRLAQLDALAADIDVAGALDERADVAIALAAKRAKGVAVATAIAGRLAPAIAQAGFFRWHWNSFADR